MSFFRMQTSAALFLCTLFIPLLSLAADCPVVKGSTNQCQSETIVVDTKSKCPVSVTAGAVTKNCKCTKTQKDGKTVYSGGGTITCTQNGVKKTIDKCDPAAKLLCGQGAPNAAPTANPEEERAAAAVASIDTSTDDGREQLTDVLTGLGVQNADTIVTDAESAKRAQEYLTQLAAGNEAEAKKIADELGIKLNPDIKDFASLKANLSQSVTDNIPKEQTDKFITDNTFGAAKPEDVAAAERDQPVTDPIVKAKCAIATIESGSCGGNYSALNKRSGALGKYQVMPFNLPAWTPAYCGRRYSPGEFLADGDCQEKVFEGAFGALMQKCGGFNGAASAWFSGKCHITNTNDGSTWVSQYVQRAASIFGSTNIPFSATVTQYNRTGSPFVNVSPWGPSPVAASNMPVSGEQWPAYSSAQSPPSYSSGVAPSIPSMSVPVSSQPSTPLQQVQQLATQIQQSIFGAPPQAPAPAPTPVQPVASIVVQPKSVTRGNPVIVSWSSVGMQANAPCTVLLGTGSSTSTIAQANEGSERIPTDTSTGSTWNVTLQCTSLAGDALSQTVSVSIK